MEQTCTCGATAPSNARFCPMCGRPLAEETAPPNVEGESEVLTHLRQQAADSEEEATPRVGFGNPDALRSAYPGAFLAAVLGNIPFLHLLCFVWYPGAGFLSVHNYRKRTGSYPTTSEGARLGWMTGVLTFVISIVLLASVMLFAGDSGDIAEALRQQIDQMPGQADMKQQMKEMIRNPVVIAFMFIIYLVISFLLTVGLTAIGGALGAKVLDKD